MYFKEYLKKRLEDSPTIKNGNQLAKAITTEKRTCGRANVSLWLSGDRYPSKPYLHKIVDVLSTSKKDKRQMILDIWELEDGLE